MTQLWSNTYNYDALYPKNNRNNYYLFIGSNGRIQTNDLINNYSIKSILDYGCGYSNSVQSSCNNFNITDVVISKYDPFIPEFSTHPDTPSDFVVCYNVLQFVEPQFLNNVVQDISNLSNKITLFNIVIPPIGENTVSNTNPIVLKYINAFQSANLNIVDFKISNTEDKIVILGNTITDETKTVFRSYNTLDLTILASKT